MIYRPWMLGLSLLLILSPVLGRLISPEALPVAEDPGTWTLTGNADTNPATNFLGTTDNAALEIRVDNERALRLEPPPEANFDFGPNVIGGFGGNRMDDGVGGGTVSGGGQAGFPNRVTASLGTVGGGTGNRAAGQAAVAGGFNNIASGFRAAVGGGSSNVADSGGTTIGGGTRNTASFSFATVGGGSFNTASALHATVAGGTGNVASGNRTTVGGGTRNVADGLEATIGGGTRNLASQAYATVGGGLENIAAGRRVTISGGAGNIASSEDTTIGGGLSNRTTDRYGTIGGGRANLAGNMNDNIEDARYATVSGGQDNSASGLGATVGGGLENTAAGTFATVPGGLANEAAGDYSFAAGRRARIEPDHEGALVYADSNDVDFNSVAANEFAVRATGGIRFVTEIDTGGVARAGVQLAAGGSSWQSLSDRYAKANVVPVDERDVLARLMTVPISTWHYKTQDPSIRHIGPMAQDLYNVFGLGEDKRYINSVDADGLALAAIQGLNQFVQEQKTQLTVQQQQISILAAENAALQERILALETRLNTLEQNR